MELQKIIVLTIIKLIMQQKLILQLQIQPIMGILQLIRQQTQPNLIQLIQIQTQLKIPLQKQQQILWLIILY